ncbi:MAG: hypothetical protein QNJ97_17860 [Myxococcota bacterium]|nr:hypothetical protein [Myxococcota bacterium]
MTDYTQNTNFTAKDGLPSGNPSKIVLGAEFDTEFAEIELAIASKYDNTDLADQPTAEAGVDNTSLMTPLRVEQWATANLIGGDGITLTGFSIALDVNSLTTLGDPVDGANDFIALYDASTGAMRKVAASNVGGGSGTVTQVDSGTGLTGGPITTSGTLSLDTGNTRNTDHASVSLIGGTGISATGLGDLTASRTITVDLTEYTDGFDATNLAATTEMLIQVEGTPRRMAYQDAGGRVIVETTTTRSTTVGDGNAIIVSTNASTLSYTINDDTAVPIPVGAAIVVIAQGNTVDLIADTGVTFDSVLQAGGGTATRTVLDGGTGVLVHTGSNRWALSGDIS